MSANDPATAAGKGDPMPLHRMRHGQLYPDKWSSPYVSFEFPELRGRIAVEIEIWNPELPDFADNDVVFRANHRLVRREKGLRPGDLRRVIVELDADASPGAPFNFSFRSAAHFSPKLPDTRVLAMIVRKFAVKTL